MGRKADINIRYRADLTDFEKKLKRFERKFVRTGRKFKRLGQSMSRNLSLPLVGLGALATREFAKFEQSMAKVQAVSGATGKELKTLTDLSKNLGKSTRFTASQVAELELVYSKLGFSVKEIVAVTGATLDLALATGEDLTESATVAGSTLRGFTLDATNMGRVVDVMAKSFSSSALDLEKFKVSMSKIAPVANAAGISLERTVAMQSALADSGVEASTIGTSLRKIMVTLAKTGLSYNDALNKINKSTDKVKTAQAIFGDRAFAAAIILADQQKKVEDLTTSYELSKGSAKSMAKIMDDTLTGALLKVKSAVEGLAIEFGKALKPAVQKVGKIIVILSNRFSSMSENGKRLTLALVGITAALGPMIFVLGKFTIAMTTATISVVKWSVALAANPIGLMVAALAALTGAIGFFLLKQQLMTKETKESFKALNQENEVRKETTKIISQEKAQLQTLLRVARSEGESRANKLRAVRELNKLSPEFLGNITLEQIATEKTTTAINAYTDALFSRAKAIAVSNKIIAKEEEILEAQIAINNEASKSFKEAQKRKQEAAEGKGIDVSGFVIDREIINGTAEATGQILNFVKVLGTAPRQLKNVGGEMVVVGSESEKLADKIIILRSELKDLQDIGETVKFDPIISGKKTTDSDPVKIVAKEQKAILELKIRSINREIEALDKIRIQKDVSFRNEIKATDAIKARKVEIVKLERDFALKSATSDAEKLLIQDKFIEKLKLIKKQFKEIEKVTSFVPDPIGPTSFFKFINDKLEELKRKYQQVFESISATTSAFFTKNNAEIDVNHQKQLDAIQGSKLSEEEKARRIERLEERTEKKRRQIARRQAIAEKAAAIFQTTINAILAVSKQLAQGNIFKAAAIGSLALAQVAAVSATPLPALAEGGIAFGPTAAIVGDNPNARVDPEVIAPLSKIRNMGSTVAVMDMTLRGRDIFISQKLEKQNMDRFR